MAAWTAAAGLVAVFAVRFAPEYSLQSSYLLTSAIFILMTWAASFVYNCILYPNYLTPLKHLPTLPNRSWIYGNTNSLKLRFPVEEGRTWSKMVPNDGLIRYYVTANWERVLLVSPKAISDLLVSKSYDFGKPQLARKSLEQVTGEGVLIAEGDVHKSQRKSLMPSFSHRHIKDLYPIFWAKAIQMTNEIGKGIKSNKGESTITIRNWASRAMLDIIGLAGISSDFNAVKDPDNELARRYASLDGDMSGLHGLLLLVFIFFIGIEWFRYVPTRQNRKVREAVKYIRQAAHKLVSEKRARMQKVDDKDEMAAGIDIISVAMRSGNFTDSNLVDQMMTFLAAGHETTASAFQWAVYALSKHPEMQARLRKDIREALPDIPFDELDSLENINDLNDKISSLNAAIDSNNNRSLPYLWAFTSEVLRFYPSVPFTAREALCDTTLAGQHIPKGTNVLISPDLTNRDEDFWGPDAGTFNPERWIDSHPNSSSSSSGSNTLTFNNNGGAKSNYVNLTFIHGPRSCIGQGFAKAELAIFVAVFVHRFEFELSDPQKELDIRRNITQSPSDGVVVKIRAID